MSERELWLEYEREKAVIAAEARTPQDYEDAIKALARRLGV